MVKIKIKYFNKDIIPIEKFEFGDWIDLRAGETVELKKGEVKNIPLGIGMILPEGYEAHVIPRSSIYKNFGIMQVNSMALIDESFNGNEDQWIFQAYALKDTVINLNDRIAQFRIVEKMPKIEIEVVDNLNIFSRGGIGSTGKK